MLPQTGDSDSVNEMLELVTRELLTPGGLDDGRLAVSGSEMVRDEGEREE